MPKPVRVRRMSSPRLVAPAQRLRLSAVPEGDVEGDELMELLHGGGSVKRLDHHTLMFSGEVTESAADEFVVALRSLESELLMGFGPTRAQVPGYSPYVRVELSTPGGDAYAGLRMVDAMRSCRLNVETVASGLVASMGIFLLLAGDRRLAYPGAYLMIHDVFSGKMGPLMHLRTYMGFLERMQQDMYQVILDNTFLSAAELKKLSAEEYWFGAGEALEMGLVDGLVDGRKCLVLP